MGETNRAKTFRTGNGPLSPSNPRDDVLVLALDREGRIISFNKSLELLTGYTAAEVKGKYFWELFLTPEEGELARCSFEGLVNGEPSCGRLNFCRTKSGGKKLISWSDRAVADEKGVFSYVLKTGVDIDRSGRSGQEWWTQGAGGSGTAEGEQDPALSEERWGYERLSDHVVPVAETLADAVVITDERGIIRYANPAFERVTGYACEDALGRDLHLIDSGRQDEAFYRELRSSLRQADTWNGSLVNKKKDGTLYEEGTTIALLRNKEGKAQHYISIRRDLTGLRRNESLNEAVAATSAVSDLLMGLIQEIGNPVNSTKLVLSMLRDNFDVYDKVTIKEYIQRSLDELAKVEEFMWKLKKYASHDRQDIQEVVLGEFVEKLISRVDIDLAARGIALKTSFDPALPVCAADPRALQQALLIVLSNAADASTGRAKPEIFFGAEPALGGMVLLRVADNGSGMDEAQQRNLFRPFYTTKPRGSGLGLLTAKRILARMNSTISITSKKGEGTVVDILIPQKSNAN